MTKQTTKHPIVEVNWLKLGSGIAGIILGTIIALLFLK
jgi:hypothetical protein